jgi:hypothetical protein
VGLHPVVYAGHVVHSGASEARNVDALFLMLVWDWCKFNKNARGHVMPNLCFASSRIYASRCALRCVRGVKRRSTIFLARVGPVHILEKAHRDVGHVVHFGASGVRNIDTLFFLLLWD